MHRILKHKLLAGATVAAVVAFGGGAYAATHSGTSQRQAFDCGGLGGLHRAVPHVAEPTRNGLVLRR